MEFASLILVIRFRITLRPLGSAVRNDERGDAEMARSSRAMTSGRVCSRMTSGRVCVRMTSGGVWAREW
jgi:hypothetical protein